MVRALERAVGGAADPASQVSADAADQDWSVAGSCVEGVDCVPAGRASDSRLFPTDVNT